MKESMIHDLYFGSFCPWERARIRTQEYSTTAKKIADIAEHFKDLLSAEEYAKFTEMQNLRAEIELMEDVELFEYAFCAGARLMIDVFTYKGQ